MKVMGIPYNNYKTQRCKYFDDTGNCKFGKNCSYAHGDAELRNPYDNLPVTSILPTAGFMPDGSAGGMPYDMFGSGGMAPMDPMSGMSTTSNGSPLGDGSDIKLIVNSNNDMETQTIR
jgi:hypothetical protein